MVGRFTTRWVKRPIALMGVVIPLALAATFARAETAWIKDEVRLNLRTGPGVQYRIMGVVKTNESVEVLARGEGWTQIRIRGQEEGWIPVGYLQPTPPAAVLLVRAEEEVETLRQQLTAVTSEAAALRETNDTLSGRDGEQRQSIEQLSRENLELRAGARWPEWITGACILAGGMLMGVLWHRYATRRPARRVRL
jgi:SH3 domain protein